MDFDTAGGDSSPVTDDVPAAWHLAGAESSVDLAMMMAAAGPGARPGRGGP